jgi:hypothetical protein
LFAGAVIAQAAAAIVSTGRGGVVFPRRETEVRPDQAAPAFVKQRAAKQTWTAGLAAAFSWAASKSTANLLAQNLDWQ